VNGPRSSLGIGSVVAISEAMGAALAEASAEGVTGADDGWPADGLAAPPKQAVTSRARKPTASGRWMWRMVEQILRHGFKVGLADERQRMNVTAAWPRLG
jgi:hypothetical protein